VVPARAVWRAPPLRDDALQVECAGVPEDRQPVALDRLAQGEPVERVGDNLGQKVPTQIEALGAQIATVEIRRSKA